MQKAYLNVILHVKHIKLSFIAILSWFLILGEIQDGDHCCWRHRPPAAPSLIKNKTRLLSRSKAFHWRQKRFKILQIILIKNSGEGFYPPPPPHTTLGYEFACTSEGSPCEVKLNYLFQSFALQPRGKNWKGIIKIMMMMMMIIINITIITMQFSFAKLQFAG